MMDGVLPSLGNLPHSRGGRTSTVDAIIDTMAGDPHPPRVDTVEGRTNAPIAEFDYFFFFSPFPSGPLDKG
jgi:hypothetical protein